MSTIMSAAAFAAEAERIARSCKTLYVMGAFGAPLNEKNKERYCQNHAYNRQPARSAMIRAAGADTFAFDCAGFVKGILWGWEGDPDRVYGGAVYEANGVPDTGANGMIALCDGVTEDFTDLAPGELLWKQDHLGVYLGRGLAAECSPAWANDAQITALGNLTSQSEYPIRVWTSHGRLPWLDYSATQEPGPAPGTPFTDVDPDSGYYAAIRWCYENGIVKGTGKNSYSPKEPVTREQEALFLYRLANWCRERFREK